VVVRQNAVEDANVTDIASNALHYVVAAVRIKETNRI
jgi:hypothetical protein